MRRNIFKDENYRLELKYSKIYSFFTSKKERQGIYIGHNLNGMGRILSRRGEDPIVHSFNLIDTLFEGNFLKGKFYFLFLTDKEKSFAREILNKKSL